MTARSPLIAITDEPAPRLFVDPPLAGPLGQGRAFIQYRVENVRIMPVFGEAALAVSPRIGHIHVTVDDSPWHFIETNGETIVVVGLLPGDHQLRVELADATHRVVDCQIIRFTVPHPAISTLVSNLNGKDQSCLS